MGRFIVAMCLLANLTVAATLRGQQGQSGEISATSRVDGVPFQTDYQPGQILWGEGAAEVSVASGGMETDFRIKAIFFDASNILMGSDTEYENNIQPGAAPVSFLQDEEYLSDTQITGNYYDFYAKLQYLDEVTFLWEPVDEDWIRFTTD